LDVHSPAVLLEGGGHIDVFCPVSEVANLSFLRVYCACELIDAVAGFGKALVGSCSSSSYCGDEAIGDSVCSGLEVATLVHVEDSFG